MNMQQDTNGTAPASTEQAPSGAASGVMSCDDILAAFSHPQTYPRAAVAAAVARWEEITPRLIAILEALRDDPSRLRDDEDFMAHIIAAVLLGHFGEKRVHPVLIELFGKPGREVHDLFGDMTTEDLRWILYRTCDDHGERIASLLYMRDADEFVRSAAAQALVYLVATGQRSRTETLDTFAAMFASDEPASRFDWYVTRAMCMLSPGEHASLLKRARADGFDDDDIDDAVSRGEEASLAEVRDDLRAMIPNDVHEHLSWWACFKANHAAPGPRSNEQARKKKRAGEKAARKRNRKRR